MHRGQAREIGEVRALYQKEALQRKLLYNEVTPYNYGRRRRNEAGMFNYDTLIPIGQYYVSPKIAAAMWIGHDIICVLIFGSDDNVYCTANNGIGINFAFGCEILIQVYHVTV